MVALQFLIAKNRIESSMNSLLSLIGTSVLAHQAFSNHQQSTKLLHLALRLPKSQLLSVSCYAYFAIRIESINVIFIPSTASPITDHRLP